MIDFSPYQVWFIRSDGPHDEAEAFATGPHSYVHVRVGNASRLANSSFADSWLSLIKRYLDNFEADFLTFAE